MSSSPPAFAEKANFLARPIIGPGLPELNLYKNIFLLLFELYLSKIYGILTPTPICSFETINSHKDDQQRSLLSHTRLSTLSFTA
jgi:hypothetical protein